MQKKSSFLVIILLFMAGCVTPQKNNFQVYSLIAEDFLKGRIIAKKTIAVLPLEAQKSLPSSLGLYTAERITHAMVNRGFSMIERSRINKVMKEQSFSQSGALSYKKRTLLGKLLSVDILIIGTVSLSGNRLEILVRAIDVKTGLILGSSLQSRDYNVQSHNKISRNNDTSWDGNNTVVRDNDVDSQKIINSKTRRVIIPDEVKPKVHIKNIKFFRSGRSLYLIGQIKNKGAVDVSKPVLTFSLKNRAGDQIAVIKAFVSRHLYKGETLPFFGLINPVPKYNSYSIVYEPEKVKYTAYYRFFVSKNERFRKKRYWGYEVTGILINKNKVTVSYPKIILMFYNKKGVYIGSANGYASLKRLKPGKSSPYSVNVSPSSLNGKPASYKMIFSSLRARH